MQVRFNQLVAAAIAVAMSATTAFGADQSTSTEHKFEKAKAYHAECEGVQAGEFEQIREKIKAFTDAELMAETMNDPEKLAELSTVVNDPHTIHVMASCASEPVMWNTWMRNGTDFNKMTAAATKMMNPAGMMKWMMAPMNPKIWQSMTAHMNPEKYTKWATAAGNPTFYKPVTNMADPKWYESRVQWASDPNTFTPFTNMFAMFMPTATAPAKPAEKPTAE